MSKHYSEQQKWLSHLVKNLIEVENTAQGRAKWVRPRGPKRLCVQPWHSGVSIARATTLGEPIGRAAGRPIEETLTRLLRDGVLAVVGNQRFLDGCPA